MATSPGPTLYLDNNATTAMADEVYDAMQPFLRSQFANPSSPYTFARGVSLAVADARARVAELMGGHPQEVIFTSGGTESNNAALHAATVRYPGRRQLVTSAVEHASVLKSFQWMESRGYRVTYVGVDSDGTLDIEEYEHALSDETALVSIMAANNETGVLFPVGELAVKARERGILFHTDAVQAVGKIPVDVSEWGVDLLSVSGHKLHAPKGIGVLWARRGLKFSPFHIGGDQERGRRGGTENVAGIVGLGVASALVADGLTKTAARVASLRDDLEQRLLDVVPGLDVAGAKSPRLPNTSALLLDKIEAEAVLALLDMQGICCSSGSACTAGSTEPSHVLQAMGLTRKESQAAVRFSLSRYTSPSEIDAVVAGVGRILDQVSL